jgi:PAS domain S-box-containing protein
MHRVLIVDDSELILAQLTDALSSLGYEVAGSARSGAEGVQAARELAPEVILMDILMPGEPDGIEAARLINNELDIPVIFLTAAEDDAVLARAGAVGAYGFMSKPVNRVVLKANIDMALARRASESDINETLREFADNTNDLIYIVDVKGRIKYVNRQIMQIGGFTEKSFIGTDFISFLTPQSVAKAVELFKRQAKGEDVGPFELDFVDRSGGVRTLELRERPVWRGGRIVEVHGIGRDVTDRKHAQDEATAAREQYRLLVENAVEGIAVTQDGVIKYANSTLMKLAGYAEGGLVGQPFAGFIHPDDREAVIEGHRQVVAGKNDPTPVTRLYLDRTGSVHVVENTSMPCTWEGRPAAIVLINDVTDIRLTEQLLTIQRDIGVFLSTAEDLGGAMAGVLERLLSIPGLDCGGIYLVEEPGGALRLATHRGLSKEFVSRVEFFGTGSREAGEVATGGTILFPAAEIESDTDFDYMRAEGITYLVVAPVLYEGAVVASVNVASHEKDTISSHVVAAVEDVAARLGSAIQSMKNREQLAESEKKYRTLTENAKEGIAVIQDGIIKYANPTLHALSGYPAGGLPGLSFIDFIHPDERAEVLRNHHLIVTGREASSLTTGRYIDRAGSTHIIDNTTIPCTWEGRPAAIGLLNDVTDSRLTERLLTIQRDIGIELSTENELAKAMAQVLDRLLTIPGVDCGAVHLAEEAEGPLKLAVHRGVTDAFESWVLGPGLVSTLAGEVRAGRSVALGRTRIDRSPDLGSAMHAEGLISVMAAPVFDEGANIGAIIIGSHTEESISPRIVAAVEDISVRLGSAIRRIRDQELLAESEKKYRMLTENAKEGIVVVQDGLIKYVNPTGVRISGYTEEELLERPFAELVYPEDLAQVSARYEREMAGESLRDPHSYRVTWKDGTVRWAEGIGVPIEWEGRRASLSFIEDITKQKLVQDALVESERKFRGVFETSRDFMYIAALDGTILDYNGSAREFFGYTDEEIRHLNLKDVYAYPEEREPFVQKVVREGFVENFEIKLKKKDGTLIDTLVTVVLRTDGQGSVIGLQGSVKDITRMKRLERQLIQTEKLSSLGTIVSGIAHELNNPLTGILGNAEILAKQPGLPEDVVRRLEIISKESIRAAKIIKGLLSFAREHKPERRLININDCIMESYKLREYDLRVNTIQVELSLSNKLHPTYADPYQIQQVFVNIINNARDALFEREGATLVIRSRQQGEWLIVEFVDNGPGIDPENHKRIFDPFFTTKEVGKGTGLGLSMAYGIINEHGGTIEAAGAPGGGTIFTVSIPVSGAPASDKKTAEAFPDKGQAGKHILVVEDEGHLRDLFTDVLAVRGYTVQTASGAEEAIELVKGTGFDAIITDIKMPGPGGMGLYRYVADNHPDLAGKVIFITGDILGGETRSFLAATDCVYLEKPFNISALLNALAAVLAR